MEDLKEAQSSLGLGGSGDAEVQGLPVTQVQGGRWKKVEGEQRTLARRRNGHREQRQI